MINKQGKPLDTARGKRNDPYYQAQDILSRRDHSEYEVRQKMKRKGFTATDTEKAINWFKEKHLLDDQRFAERYITSILRTKAVGPRWLAYKLKQRGIASDLIQQLIASAIPPDQEKELARQAAQRWRQQHTTQQINTQRLQRFLLSRGFSFTMIESAIAEFARPPAGG